MAARSPTPDEKAEYLAELRRRADEGDPVYRALLKAHLDPNPRPISPEEEAFFAAQPPFDESRPRKTQAEIEAMIDAWRRSEEG